MMSTMREGGSSTKMLNNIYWTTWCSFPDYVTLNSHKQYCETYERSHNVHDNHFIVKFHRSDQGYNVCLTDIEPVNVVRYT
jgi:hypothetical protein